MTRLNYSSCRTCLLQPDGRLWQQPATALLHAAPVACRPHRGDGVAPANQIVVRIEPVVIPPELDRVELVSRGGPYRVHIATRIVGQRRSMIRSDVRS